MSLDDLRPQPPRTPANTRQPGPANAYGKAALAATRQAQAACRHLGDIAFGPDYYQKLDIYLPAGEPSDVPVLLFFHGGAWQHGYKEWCGHMAPAFVDLPAIFVAASYRKVPEAKFPAPLEDAFLALQWVWRNVAEHGGDPHRIIAGGWSVGGTLASLITLRRDMYGEYGLPGDVVKACLSSSAGYRYLADLPAPGDSGITYGELMYLRPEDQILASPLSHVKGNRTPFHISHGEEDFDHVKGSSADMVEALEAEGSAVTYQVFAGMDHYGVNLAQGDRSGAWVKAARVALNQTTKHPKQ